MVLPLFELITLKGISTKIIDECVLGVINDGLGADLAKTGADTVNHEKFH